MHIASAVFVKSASKPIECPPETLPEFAVIGRSNVGKSSLINMLTQRSGLAKESTTPGKTQLINYFIVNDQRYLVDLPGYGYAKSSIEDRRYWMDTTQKFFTSRTTLRRIFVLVD
jgi:GTP-binding protein